MMQFKLRDFGLVIGSTAATVVVYSTIAQRICHLKQQPGRIRDTHNRELVYYNLWNKGL